MARDGITPNVAMPDRARLRVIRNRNRGPSLGLRHEPVGRSTLSGMMPRRLTSFSTSIFISITVLLSLAMGAIAFAQAATNHKSGVQQKPFGTRDGRPINLFTLTNANGVEVDAMNYGGIIVSIRVPDRKG